MPRLIVPIAVLLLLGAAHAQDEAVVLFKSRCAGCHGADGAGRTPSARQLKIPNLRSPKVQKCTDDELFKTIAYGSGHRNYPHVFVSLGVTEPQVRLLVKYIRGLAAK